MGTAQAIDYFKPARWDVVARAAALLEKEFLTKRWEEAEKGWQSIFKAFQLPSGELRRLKHKWTH